MSMMLLQSLREEFGERATSSPMECELYSRDLGPVPAMLVDPLFHTVPNLIVRPQTTAEVASLVRRAGAEGVPITPRAGGTTVFFNAVPVKSGIVMDLNELNGVVTLDEAGMTVTVKAATTWSDLEAYLNTRGLACKSMPSSAPAATVGGWLSMMGYGIGSLKYGSLLSQVRSLEVVLPEGNVQRITRTTKPSLDWFAASEGTLGIVTEVELEIRPLTSMKHYLLLLNVPDIRQAVQIMQDLIKSKARPYNMHFADNQFLKTMKALGFSHIDMESGVLNALKTVKDLGFSHLDIESGFLVAVDYEGSEDELVCAGKEIGHYITPNKFTTHLPDELAEMEWNERYKTIRIKRGGPAVLGGEMWLPIGSLQAYLKDIRKMAETYNVNLMSYGHVVSSEQATVMSMFFADETKTLQYIINLSLVKKIQDVGYRHGGRPYGIGLWNTPYLGRIYTSSQLKDLKARKRHLDPQGIMNPGKVYQPPFMLNAFNFYVGMEVFALIRQIFGKRW